MSTENQYITGKNYSQRNACRQLASLVVAGDATVKASIVLPAGSWIRGVTIETATAISGSPTHANVQAGLTDGGTEVVAAVDAQAQGHIAATLVAALDKVGACAAADTTLYLEVITTGGTAPAGTINVLVDYDAPIR